MIVREKELMGVLNFYQKWCAGDSGWFGARAKKQFLSIHGIRFGPCRRELETLGGR
jgi:hypothetical protein